MKIAYEVVGDSAGETILLLHGWPDSASSWRAVAPLLQARGYRTITPCLRGSYPTEFLSHSALRFVGAVAFAQDVIDLADRLGIPQFSVLGHDWGARIAYTLTTLFPDQVRAIAALALAYQPRGKFVFPNFDQARHFWYQLFQCTAGGADAVRRDPVGFARM